MNSAAVRRYALVEVAAKPVTIGEAARRTGLTPRAIRLYEEHNFIVPVRNDNEVRLYDQRTVARLQHIALLRRADLPLRDIGGLLGVLDAEGEAAMRRRLLTLLTEQAANLDRQRQRLEAIRHQLLTPATQPAAKSA